MSDQKPYTPTEIDNTEDRMGSIEQLDFDQRRDERKGRIGDEVPGEEVADEFTAERARSGRAQSTSLVNERILGLLRNPVSSTAVKVNLSCTIVEVA